MKIRVLALAGAISTALLVAGCQTVASDVSTAASYLSGSSTSQVTTLADAQTAAKLATDTVDLAVNTGKLDVATLKELKALSDGVHAALDNLEATNAAGGNLVYGSFNAALAAFNAYKTAQGIASASS